MSKMTVIPPNYDTIRHGVVKLVKSARSAAARNVEVPQRRLSDLRPKSPTTRSARRRQIRSETELTATNDCSPEHLSIATYEHSVLLMSLKQVTSCA